MPSDNQTSNDPPAQLAPTAADFRSAGFTAEAANYPLSDAACRWLADFNGVPIEALPQSWRYAPNGYMRDYLEARVNEASAQPSGNQISHRSRSC